MIHKPLDILKR